MRSSQRWSCLHWVWCGNLILTILSCENPSNIWELKYGPQMCGANKLTGEVELVLLRNEWISLFSYGTFQRYVFMFSTRTSGNGFNCLTKHGATFSLLNISVEAYVMLGLWWTCLRCDIFFLMVETEESTSETDNDHILQEASELWSCN